MPNISQQCARRPKFFSSFLISTVHDLRFRIDYLRKMVICKHLQSTAFPCGAGQHSAESALVATPRQSFISSPRKGDRACSAQGPFRGALSVGLQCWPGPAQCSGHGPADPSAPLPFPLRYAGQPHLRRWPFASDGGRTHLPSPHEKRSAHKSSKKEEKLLSWKVCSSLIFRMVFL